MRRSAPRAHGPTAAITTDPTEVCRLLRRHWATIFKRKETDARLYAALSKTFSERIHIGPLSVFDEDITQALRRTRAAAPGPDGIAAAAWLSAGPRAAGTLRRTYEHLSQGNAPPQSLNDCTLLCIPKGSLPSDTGTATREAGSTGPLGLKHADIKVLSTIAARHMVPAVSAALQQTQRGFLPGRSILDAVIQVDAEARRAAIDTHNDDDPILIAFDIAAAVPSISRECINEALELHDIPTGVRNFVRATHARTRIWLQGAATHEKHFTPGSGVSQGCPLSALLFIITA